MMKNNEWIDLPIFDTEIYPKKIVDIANKVSTPVEEIARIENTEPGVVVWEWIKREDISGAFRIRECPHNPDRSIVLLITGEVLTVDMPHRKLMSKIHKFLLSSPQYDFSIGEPQIVEMEQEEDENVE